MSFIKFGPNGLEKCELIPRSWGLGEWLKGFPTPRGKKFSLFFRSILREKLMTFCQKFVILKELFKLDYDDH